MTVRRLRRRAGACGGDSNRRRKRRSRIVTVFLPDDLPDHFSAAMRYWILSFRYSSYPFDMT